MSKIIISDAHLNDGYELKAKLLIRFMEKEVIHHETLYILGDFFDVWPGTNAYLVKKYKPVIHTLRQLCEEGIEIIYLEGNHDFRLGSFFSEELGIKVYPNFLSETWMDKKVILTHGDWANRKDHSQQILRKFLRLSIVHQFKKCIPPKILYNIGKASSSFSRRCYMSYRLKHLDLIKMKYRDIARNFFLNGYDIVIMGHTHLPDDIHIEIDGRLCRYINVGDWMEHFSYLEFDSGCIYTKTYPLN